MLSIISRKLSTLSLSCLNIILIELSTFSECWDWHSQQTKVFEAILAITMDLYVAFIYTSRPLVTHEKNYSPYLLEMQAAIWG